MYQAKVAVRFCLECVRGDTSQIRAVIGEHFEDIALDTEVGWRFLQVKTRDQHLGPWRLTHLTGDGGALRALYRSYNALEGIQATFEIWLEGAIDRSDLIDKLRTKDARQSDDLIAQVAERLEISKDKCSKFLQQVRLQAVLETRDTIDDSNVALLGRVSPRTPYEELRAIYERLKTALVAAIEAGRPPEDWLQALVLPPSAERKIAELVERKTLTRDQLRGILMPLEVRGRTLLSNLVSADEPEPSLLVRKLMGGGATNSVVGSAKQLRAFTSFHKAQRLSSTTSRTDDLVEDVRERLKILALTRVDLFEHDSRPAIVFFSDLLSELAGQAATLDPEAIFQQDGMLLMGEVCQLSDECATHWGNADA